MTLLHFLVKQQGRSPAVLTFTYGQKHSKEVLFARRQAELIRRQETELAEKRAEREAREKREREAEERAAAYLRSGRRLAG